MTNLGSAFPWNIGSLPFYYINLPQPTNGNALPDDLPFYLDTNMETGTLVQVPNIEVSKALTKVYQLGSMITGMMDKDGIGAQYAEDFISFLTKSGMEFDNLNVLEIGCGTGYLLYCLKLLGANVLGIEPGPQAISGSLTYEVPIINDFFPSELVKYKFDLIVLYGVLEHIENTKHFLNAIKQNLADGGRIAVSVPDCTPYLIHGDISMLMHEHWNYYTKITLENTIRKYTGLDCLTEVSSFGGALYSITLPDQNILPKPMNYEESDIIKYYPSMAIKSIKRISSIFKEMLKDMVVGIYVPARAINLLFLMRENLDFTRIRFFDDNSLIHGCYFPGFNIKIESFQELISNPPDYIIIMSSSFGQQISAKINIFLNGLQIITWEALFKDIR